MSGPVPCRNCGQPVPPGRLACPACGTLVASVTSPVVDAAPANDPPTWPTGAAERWAEPEPEPLAELQPAPESEPKAEPVPAPEPKPAPKRRARSESGPAPRPEPEQPPEPSAVAAGLNAEPEATPEPKAAPEPDAAPEPEAIPEPTASPDPEPDAEPTATWPTRAAPLEAWAPRTALPPQQAPPHFRPESEPGTETEAAATAAGGLASGGLVPGAYLPPSSVHRPPPPSSEVPQPPAAGGWPGPAISTRPASSAQVQGGPWIPPTPASLGAGAGAALPSPTTAAAKPLVPGRSSILADLPFDAPAELEGWLVALGSGIAIIGFFLPWTASLGSGLQGYFGSWGLGIVSHLPVFIFLVIVTGLAILPNRVASWVRTGVCGMVGGGILFGIVWLYLGSDASQLGALLAAVGAVLLIVGGIIAVAPGRAARHREGG